MTPGETISVSSASIKGAMAFEVSELEAMEIASSEASCSLTFYEELVNRNRDQSVSDYIVMFFWFVTAGEVRTRAEFFKPFITGLSNSTVDQVCAHFIKYSIESFESPMMLFFIVVLQDID
ncbi:PREDICTED: ubiquitin thioesterase otubain-like [Brassica oleracea var. oleracea]|uniref:ubiquitin thioesterase otubain-like n=1 Tax=Brassica oleracea var. oleracea TaxID=109376 RepID=UPI0006A73D5A|nr:PREDICTED: ubiquitin thioesterase otubain-like [Brassica oleracea var. oleracea]